MAPQEKPKDLFHCVGIIFFLLGLGTLLPWNFFITAIPYFEARLTVGNCSARQEAAENRTASDLRPVSVCKDAFSFSNWLTLLSQLPLLLFTFLNSLLYRWWDTFSLRLPLTTSHPFLPNRVSPVQNEGPRCRREGVNVEMAGRDGHPTLPYKV